MSSEPSWDLFRTFAAVLSHGSLSGAARMLGLTQPTVARQIDALEASLGTKLFVRTYHGLSPTAAAVRLVPRAEAVGHAAAAFLRAASTDDQISGSVRITVGETVGTEYLPPILASLRREHPQLHFELSLSDAIEDLLQRKADVAVRMTKPDQRALMTRHVQTIELGLYAHVDYLKRRGRPRSWQDLITHDLIGFDTDTPAVRAVSDRYPVLARANFALRTDSAAAQLAALRSGFGIGYCQTRIAERMPELVRVLDDELSISFEMWVAMHESLAADPACQAVYEGLSSALSGLA